jgi:hypothetical protein
MISLFASAEASVPAKFSGNKNLLLWIGLGGILVAMGVVVGDRASYLN